MPAIDQGSTIYLSIDKAKGVISYKEDGIDMEVKGWLSKLHNVTMNFKPSKDITTKKGEKKKIPAHFVYQFHFKWEDDNGIENSILEMSDNDRFASSLLDALLGIALLAPGQTLYFSPYKSKTTEKTNLFISDSQDGEWLPGKFPFDPKTNTQPGVPRATNTGELDDDGKEIWDWSEVNEFWRNQWRDSIYPALNDGQVGEFPRARESFEVLKAWSEKKVSELSDEGKEDKRESVTAAVNKKLYRQDERDEILSIWGFASPTPSEEPPVEEQGEPMVEEDDLPF